ncbi:MAG TPA: ATP-dependent DNA helicase [Candidatus Saccharimonadales bacterium]|nr:ATP-dependent DNA helicase [Candidatus Saccharimonadales bacterium]
MDKEFRKAFAGLNDQQKKAVETINGPVLVIAGPGTGKTELLALRAANILKTDTTMLPSNILCLTFTNSASNNMLERLIKYIGQDAYQVAIHTFNSFGAYVMNAYPEYFYEWRETKTADELTTHSILENILSQLPGNHPLAAKNADGLFYAQTQIKNLIGDSKRADLSPDDLRQILKENKQTYQLLTPLFREFWPERISVKTALGDINKLIDKLTELKPARGKIEAVVPLQNMIVSSLQREAEESGQLESGRTKPFTAWKNQWLEKDEENQIIFTGERNHERLLAAADIYEKYQAELEAQSLVDFNDQIMWVIEAMEKHPELRYNLQERFQYIMIDEFQDTNRSQLLMTRYLTDALAHEGRPNILAVGDDDQAIYRFQGADIANVALFEQMYKDPAEITLEVNYRSNQDILTSSRQVSRQITASLEKEKSIIKQLKSTVAKLGEGVKLNEFDQESQHYSYIALEIKKLLKKGVEGKEIAVLARERVQLDALVPYMREQQIPISYERRENVLSQSHIINLLAMAKLIYWLERQELERANELFAQVLSEPMWQIEATEIWQVATEAYSSERFWLDVISDKKDGKCKDIADFFIRLGFASATTPLEQMLDELIGTESMGAQDEHDEEAAPEPRNFFSPFKQYYFGEEILKDKPAEYLTLLSHLATLRRHLRNFQADTHKTLYIKDLIELVDAYEHAGMVMLDQAQHNEDGNAVQMMTVHKAKGLEFDVVFVVGLQNDVWTRSVSRGRFAYPSNLKPIKPSDNQNDDALRLLFVAMTRARQSLYLNYFKQDEDTSPTQPYSALLGIDVQSIKPKTKDEPEALAREYEHRWLAQLGNLRSSQMAPYFEQQLQNYRLSTTHLNNFIDVSMGGPAYFFEQNLVHFPAAKSSMAVYGTVMHAALSRAHSEVLEGKLLSPKRIIKGFIADINNEALSQTDKEYYADRGAKSLKVFLSRQGEGFSKTQLVDYDFGRQGVAIGSSKLRGMIDLIDTDKKTKKAVVTDYKTGAVAYKWELPPSASEHQRVRLHRYRNQLLFYKLLVDGARNFGQQGWKADKGVLRFVEPDRGRIRSLELDYDQVEIDRFKRLVLAVWTKIQALDFPDISSYEPTLKGIQAFEEDLIKN